MALKLEEGEYIEQDLKAFAWVKWGVMLNGSWIRVYLTNRHLIAVDRISKQKTRLAWNDVESVEVGGKSLVIESSWKGKAMRIEIKAKRIDELVLEDFVSMANLQMGRVQEK